MAGAPSTPRRAPSASTSSPHTPASIMRTPAAAAATPSLDLEQDLDDPTATPSAYIRSNASSSRSGNPAPLPAADDSDAEDEAPDYLRLLSTLNSKSKASASSSSNSAGGIVIPKRGEKDFEPTGFGGQSKLLERSREAMFTAVSGERRVGSRSLVRATWDARTRRARLLDVQGKIFETVGVIRREQVWDETQQKMVTKAWNELLPEEALFLAERGSLQIYQKAEQQDQEGEEGALVPMSLQQAFAMLMLPPSADTVQMVQQDEPLTREAYLIYAHLKRLGYVVQRSSLVDAVRAAPISASALAKKNNNGSSGSSSQAAQPASKTSKNGAQADGIVADPQRPIKLTTVWDVLLYIPRRVMQLAGDGAREVARWLQRIWRHTVVRLGQWTAALGRRSGVASSRAKVGSLGLGLGLHRQHQDGRRFLGEKGNVEWDSYDAVFSSLQIVPSGHDFWLPSDSASTLLNTIQQAPGSATRPSHDHLKPFYYAWRPATLYRKSHPPPPEFRIVILNARTHPVPSVWQFESIFAQIPIPGSDQELFGAAPSTAGGATGGEQALSQEEIRERVEYEKQLKASNEAKNRAAYGKFSDGKQKFLREKAAARQQAAAQRAKQTEATHGWAQRLGRTGVAKALVKLVWLDFALVRGIAKLFRHSPGCCWTVHARPNNGRPGAGAGGRFKPRNTPRDGGGHGRGSTGNPFPPLKAGRRSVVVAVVDGSITTLLRFGEAEFAHWSLYGVPPAEQGAKQAEAADGSQQQK